MKNSNDTIGNETRDPSDLQRSASTNCATACPKRNEYQEFFLGVKVAGA
jgi:hypothetical protein